MAVRASYDMLNACKLVADIERASQWLPVADTFVDTYGCPSCSEYRIYYGARYGPLRRRRAGADERTANHARRLPGAARRGQCWRAGSSNQRLAAAAQLAAVSLSGTWTRRSICQKRLRPGLRGGPAGRVRVHRGQSPGPPDRPGRVTRPNM
jgi:hypothetical protein